MSVGFLAVALFWEAFAQNELPAISFRVLIFNRIITKYKKKNSENMRKGDSTKSEASHKVKAGWVDCDVRGRGRGRGRMLRTNNWRPVAREMSSQSHL